MFTCNHCPTAQLYESRIKKLADDYRERGVALVAIEPSARDAVRLDEMGYTDVSDSLEEMKIRAEYRRFNFPYLYDGETQKVSHAYGPTATPHVFIFDSARHLRYEGRVDNKPREQYVTQHDARNAIDALLAGKPVPVAKTPSFSCSTKWAYKSEGKKEEMTEIKKEPVSVTLASGRDLKALRKNSTGKLLLVDFWATWCGPCVKELPEFQMEGIKRSSNVIALALFMQVSYGEVLRCLLEGLAWLLGPRAAMKITGKSGISQARTRLGWAVMQQLHDQLVKPVAVKSTRGAWYRRWRLVSLDDSTLNVADEQENAQAFGRPSGSRGASAYPQLRFVSLVENGTHVLFGSRLGGCATGEISLAPEVIAALQQGMLCLAFVLSSAFTLRHSKIVRRYQVALREVSRQFYRSLWRWQPPIRASHSCPPTNTPSTHRIGLAAPTLST